MYRDFIDDNEKIIEIAKPDKFIYTFWHLRNIGVLIFLLIWTVVVVFIGRQFIFFEDEMLNPGIMFKFFPLILLAIPFIIFIINPILRYIQSSKIEYIITDKRVYIFSGVIGKDIQSIEYREIDKLKLNVGILEKIRGKGTIQLTPDQSYYNGDTRYTEYGHRLIGIDKPYEIYKLLKNNTLDIVTDQQFPNEYRPNSNKGYNTKLDNDK
ncbi:MAG: PH domain-containing protein [Helcococcus sp.]|nr:PH domain-containing protein [Helcococcus sp.]